MAALLDAVILVTPCWFQSSIHKSSKQLGYSFALDTQTLWNFLPDDFCAAACSAALRRLKTCLYTKAYPGMSDYGMVHGEKLSMDGATYAMQLFPPAALTF